MTAAPALYINTEAYNENRIFFSNSTPLEKGTAFVKIPLEKTFKKEVFGFKKISIVNQNMRIFIRVY